MSLNDLPEVIGISRAMFFGYRSQKYEPSRKVLMKLQLAEEKAGLIKSETLPIPSQTKDMSVLKTLRACIENAQAAEAQIKHLKSDLETLLKQL